MFRALNQYSVMDILVAHGLLRNQQSFQTDGLDRNAVKIDRLGVMAQYVEILSVCIEQEVDDECIGDTDILSFRKPFRFKISCGPVGQHHQCVLDPLPACTISWNKQVDIYRGPLVAVRGQCVTSDEQVIDTMFV
jgi:hypothetical protein